MTNSEDNSPEQAPQIDENSAHALIALALSALRGGKPLSIVHTVSSVPDEQHRVERATRLAAAWPIPEWPDLLKLWNLILDRLDEIPAERDSRPESSDLMLLLEHECRRRDEDRRSRFEGETREEPPF